MIPFVKRIKTKPVRGQDTSRGFVAGERVGASGWRWVIQDANNMVYVIMVFNLYQVFKLHTDDFKHLAKIPLGFEVHNSQFR